MPDILQASLTGGELSPTLWGHTDLARYLTSLGLCRNFLVRPYGGIQSRSGFRYVAKAKYAGAGNAPRMVTFKFSETDTYRIEVGNLYMRFHRNGLPVLSGGVPVEVVTPYLISEVWALQFAQSASVMTFVHPNHPVSDLSCFGPTNWTFATKTLINGPFQNYNTDVTSSVVASAATGKITLTANKPIFTKSNIGQLMMIEQKDFGVAWQPGIVTTANTIVRSVGNYYRALSAGTTGTNIPIGQSDNWNDGGVVWKYLHNGYGVAMIGGPYIDTTHANATVISYIPDGTCVSTGIGTYGAPITPSLYAADLDGNTDATCTAHGLTLGFTGTALLNYSDGTKTSVPFRVIDANTIYLGVTYFTWLGNSESLNFQQMTTALVPTFNPPVSAGISASWKWAWGAFGNPTVQSDGSSGPGYPSAITYYQQRLALAGTYKQPDTIWMSQTNNYPNFTTSTPLQDSDAITFTLGGHQVDMVRSMLQLSKLLIITSGAVWAVGQGQGDIITPSNIPCVMQGYSGGTTLPPVGIAYSTLYVHNMGNLIRELNYQFMTDNYVGTDMTVFAHHLVEGHSIADWCWQQTPLMCVWSVREDGVLLGMTYMKEQEVTGWHRHDTQGLFKSVCSGPEVQYTTGMNEDTLYASVQRTINGQVLNFIERAETRLVLDITDSFFVDCGGTFDGSLDPATNLPWTSTLTLSGGTNWDATDPYLVLSGSTSLFASTDVGDQLHFTGADGTIVRLQVIQNVSGTVCWVRPDRTVPTGNRSVPISGWAWARDTITIPWLPNTTVSVLVDGYVQSDSYLKTITTDSTGKFTINPPGFKVQVGLGYVSDAETLQLAPAQPDSVVGKAKLIENVTVIVYETRQLLAGPDETKLTLAKTRNVIGAYNAPPNLVSDKIQIPIEATWDNSGTTLLRHTDPTPIGISAILPEMNLGQS